MVAINYTPTLAPTSGAQVTPEMLALRQEYAKHLLAGNGQPIHSWSEGVANMVDALVGGTMARNYLQTDSRPAFYTVERIDNSSGPNAILFGLGSAGGVVNISTGYVVSDAGAAAGMHGGPSRRSRSVDGATHRRGSA